jgi:DNA polymerase/3'-5' exonuclease PolX
LAIHTGVGNKQRPTQLLDPRTGSDTFHRIDIGGVASEKPAANRQPFTGNRQGNHHLRAIKALFRVAEFTK